MPDEIGHLPSRDPRRHLDDGNGAVGMGDQLREGDPVAEAEHLDGAGGDALRELELIAVRRCRIDVDPADPEADPGRPQAVGERHDLGAAAAGDHDPVHLGALDEPLEDALLLGRLGQRRVEVAVEVVGALDPEDAALAARVGGLQHGGQPTVLERPPAFDEGTHGRKRRLRHTLLGKCAAHHDLVAHPLGDLGPDPRQAQALRHGRDDRDRAVGRHGQRAVDRMAASDVGDRVDVGEVDGLADVGDLQPGASALRSTATTRMPCSRACRIARRWWRPAPTKRTVFIARRC